MEASNAGFTEVGADIEDWQKHTQNVLEEIAFNLYRTPGLIMSGGLK